MGQLVWINKSGWYQLSGGYATRAHWYDEEASLDFPLSLCGFKTQEDVHPLDEEHLTKCARFLNKLKKLGVATS